MRRKGSKTVLAIEVTSPTTREIDLDDKVLLYERCGVPLYVIVDSRPAEAGGDVRFVAYRMSADGYTRVRSDGRSRLWIEPLRFWLASEGGRVVCYDEDEKRIDDYLTLREHLSTATAEAEAEKVRAAAEKARAEAEKARAEAQRARAEAEQARAERPRQRMLKRRKRERMPWRKRIATSKLRILRLKGCRS